MPTSFRRAATNSSAPSRRASSSARIWPDWQSSCASAQPFSAGVSLIRRHPNAAAPEPIRKGATRATSAGVRESGGHSLRQLPLRKEARRRALGTAVSACFSIHKPDAQAAVARASPRSSDHRLAWAARQHGILAHDRHGRSEPSCPAISRAGLTDWLQAAASEAVSSSQAHGFYGKAPTNLYSRGPHPAYGDLSHPHDQIPGVSLQLSRKPYAPDAHDASGTKDPAL